MNPRDVLTPCSILFATEYGEKFEEGQHSSFRAQNMTDSQEDCLRVLSFGELLQSFGATYAEVIFGSPDWRVLIQNLIFSRPVDPNR